jgi:hypothetical protein
MTATVAKPPRLSRQEVEDFRREGYLMYRQPVLPQAKFDALKAHFEQKLSRLPADVRPEGMDVPHFTDTKLFDWLFADEILDLVEPILGPDIALFASHFICKPRGNGKRVPWHEDSYYWKGMLEPMEVCTLWLAIDPSTPANGCMNVIPRSHRLGGQSDYEPVDTVKNVFEVEIKRHQFNEDQKVAMILEPNQASLHDARLMHGSEANTSAIRRCGWTMRYMSAATKFHPESRKGAHQIYLARGRNVAGNQYADAAKAYPELARYRETSGYKAH